MIHTYTTYNYVGGDPINFVDTNGLQVAVPAGGSGAAVGGGIGNGTGYGGSKGGYDPVRDIFTPAPDRNFLPGWITDAIKQSSRPPGAIDAVRGAKEWGRRNGVDNAVDIFHDIKRGNRGKPGSRAADNCSVNPDTGDVFDAQGEHIGNLGEGH